ncbi:Arabinanase/levansucrase/invertase [Hortaea werneckii]|nr:Arabinanase/levansucrase/invertase [Hortaea werneckii]KAI7269057.1 Arabinanase/levansucrase/invertase [Hortaea werneckii]
MFSAVYACALFAGAALAYGGVTNETYTNPVLWLDLADIDVFRVNETYYYSASSMAYSPGAPVLQSGDLVNWEFIGHSVPYLDFGDPTAYSLENGEQAYVRGIWASSMRYRESTGLFYWVGCVDFNQTYIYTAPDAAGPWNLASTIDTCYYDCGLMFDEDDSIYVAYGNRNISIAKLNEDLQEESITRIWNATFYLEGARLYSINGTYYVLLTEPASWEWTLKSTGGIYGPYELEILANRTASPIDESGFPHQGGIVDTPEGDWYYLAFIDAYPEGRVPALSPIYFDAEGWPRLPSNDSFAVPNEYPVEPVRVESVLGTDRFEGPSLDPKWEWNHNPDTSAYSFADCGGLILNTATVTDDLYHARNTLTQRIIGPEGTATIEVDISSMQAGDIAGLSLFRDNAAYIGVQDGTVFLQRDLALGEDWNTISTGTREATASAKDASCIWFRLHANVAPASDHLGTFSYSLDGWNFEQLGTPHVWHYIKLQDFSKFWSAVSKSEFAKGASEETDIVKWTFKDGTVLEVKQEEHSTINHYITYSVITSQPELSYTSVVSTVRCYAVSSGALEGSTFVEWTGNFSSDADASVIQDAKFKRREALADLAKVAEKK